MVFLVSGKFFEFHVDVDAGAESGLEFGNYLVFFFGDVVFELFGGHLIVVFCFKGGEHAAKVLPNEIIEKLGSGVAVGDAAFLGRSICISIAIFRRQWNRGS